MSFRNCFQIRAVSAVGQFSVSLRAATSLLSSQAAPNFQEPATGQLISLPESGHPILNQIHLRSGRLPQADKGEELVVNESFAKAHGFSLGARFSALLNGRKRQRHSGVLAD
jgi:hypothetical protein